MPSIKPTTQLSNWSDNKKKIAAINTKIKTIIDVTVVSRREGHVTLSISFLTSCTYFTGLNFAMILFSTFYFLAGVEGVEPPTFGFGDRRSAN
jgi:hypothetical protein|tara:strand:- start:219 stop:497 length:279 start_codon:yes stop_codon:yes gene_type:complete